MQPKDVDFLAVPCCSTESPFMDSQYGFSKTVVVHFKSESLRLQIRVPKTSSPSP